MQTRDEIVAEICVKLYGKTNWALLFDALGTLIRHTERFDRTPNDEALLLELSRRAQQYRS